MTLSVLSAIARQDIDPWTEADRLSRLPKETAIMQITNLLDRLPRRTLVCLDRVEAAARLSALLPINGESKLAGTLQSSAIATPTQTVASFNWRFLCIYFCLVLLMNWLMAEFRTPTALGTLPAVVSKAPEPHSLSNNDEKNTSTADN